MVSMSLLVASALALVINQVTAAPQISGPPEAISIFYNNCATLDQSGIPANDTSIISVDPTCYSFSFNGIDQAFVSPGYTAVVYSDTSCTGTATVIAQSKSVFGCQIVTGSQSYTVVAI